MSTCPPCNPSVEEIAQDKELTPLTAPVLPSEGGLAGWLCVIGSALGLFCTFGFLAAIGVFQATYETSFLGAYTASNISWIFTIQLWLMWILGPVFGRITDSYGPRLVMIPASMLCVFSLFMLSFSNLYTQIFVAQGLGFGLGAGGIFNTCLVATGQWFVKHRGLATGIVTCGSSLGGVIFPFFVHKLIEDFGFADAMRYTALLIGILLAIACTLVKSRLSRQQWNPAVTWIDVHLLTDMAFGMYTLGAFLVTWGLWAPFDYLPTFAAANGFSTSLSVYLISIINAASVPGRVVPGLLADRLGYFNVMTIVSVLAGVSVACFWMPFNHRESHAGIVVFALAYGLSSGAYVSLMMPCVAKCGKLETLGQRLGTFQSFISIAALTGLPIQGAIMNRQRGSYLGLQIFSAVAMIVGGLCIGVSRMVIARTSKSSRI